MRKISEQAYNAFITRKQFKKDNTKVEIVDGNLVMFLFGNPISKEIDGEIFVSDGEHGPSNTTRDRLNTFPEVWVRHRKGKWLTPSNNEWDGQWTNINLFQQGL